MGKVDESEASGRKGNSKKLAVWDKPEKLVSEHNEYKLVSFFNHSPSVTAYAATAPPLAVAPFG